MRCLQNIQNNITGILQLGANTGQDISLFNSICNKQIYFEPDDRARSVLQSKLDKDALLNKTKFIFDFVVSDKNGEIDFFLGQEHGNSSILDLNPDRPSFHHKNIHEKKVTKKTITLDSFFDEYIRSKSYYDSIRKEDFNFLWMDIQGAEHLAIKGGEHFLESVDYIYMEVSYLEIYTGTLLFDDMLVLLDTYGFKTLEHIPSSCNQNQGDCLFIKG